ncbi:MAG: Asp23/Gls24 family envelope stress response protein [Erysipelotrichaceae bacterium]|jgi:uncharacterized alkaline shock family protein YloU|nr:Asp23/Gls24 family envelope stress response protein [Erysipelotrichaceae bacterium]
MAQEYVSVNQSSQLGITALSKSVFQTIAVIAVEEEEAVMIAGSTAFKGAVSCKVQGDQMILTLDVKVNYNANVNDVCAKLQKRLYEATEHMTGYAPDVIDIRVVGFFF